ncbi:MAG: VWA domain-containing protein [Pyrinomonadaceae bacterium]
MVKRLPAIFLLSLAVCPFLFGQASTREFKITAGGRLDISNKYGRVSVRVEKSATNVSKLIATSAAALTESDVKVSASGSRALLTVEPSDKSRRIDITLTVPEHLHLKAETTEGSIEVGGNFASIEARTITGTIVTDIPADDIKYNLTWTESRPRFLADFDIAKVKEKAAGRFEIEGTYQARARDEMQKPARKQGRKPQPDNKETDTAEKPKTIALNLTTARGIILLNVPVNEVMSDLRERPLTEAARAIIRSGDSLLTEAIRRASPKYFGDYARTLPPVRLEPTFAVKTVAPDTKTSSVKTATVRVTDLANRSVAGLAAKDFEILENGITREIVSVTRSDAPFNLVLLLDVSGSIENYVNFVRKAARSFVDTVGERDRVAIVIFNEDVKKLSGFTTDKAKLSASLDTFDAGGGTAYYDALAYTIADTLRPLKGERTAIVILTDGDDNRSFLAFDSLAGSIQESGALIYPLYVPSALIAMAAQNTDIDPLRKKYMSLTAKSEGEGDRLAKISGGVYYPITEITQIQRAYEDIVHQVRNAYDITYRSNTKPLAPGVSPKLKIRAKAENVFTTVTSVVAAN